MRIFGAPERMGSAARATDWRPELQMRMMVMPGIVSGRPARKGGDARPCCRPIRLSGIAQPRITSSTSAEPTAGYFSRRRRMTSGASSSGTGVAKRAARGFADRRAEHLQEKMF